MIPPQSTAYRRPISPVWRPAPGSPPVLTPGYSLGFFLFILVNAVLYMRPTEIFRGVFHPQTYQWLIIACFLLSVPCVLKQLTAARLVAQPITVCVLGLLLAVLLSHATQFAFNTAITSGWEFAKIVLYYLLFVGLVTTPARMRRLLFWLVLFVAAQVIVALLQYYGYINNPEFSTLSEEQGVDFFRGAVFLRRLCGSGIFHNPNEFCYPIVLGMMIALYYVCGRSSNLLARLLCLAAVGLFAYALTLTFSRGGLLGLLVALGSFLLARYGWRKALPFGILVLPALLFLSGGRQADFSLDSGTGQERIRLWSDGLVLFMRAPFFGIGTGNYAEAAGHVAHNTFIQCYTELGFFGGVLFVGAFYLAIYALYLLHRHRSQILDPEMRRLLPYVVGIVAGHMGCMLSMSLHDMIPTYAILGIVTAYLRIAVTRPSVPLPRFSSTLVLRLAALGAILLVTFHIYVRFAIVVG
jgi:O-antigen ligase